MAPDAHSGFQEEHMDSVIVEVDDLVQVKPRKRGRTRHGQYTACDGCKSRKVQCDIYTSGPPCTYCRLYDEQCVAGGSKQRKKSQNSPTDTKLIELRPNTQQNTLLENKVSDMDIIMQERELDYSLIDGYYSGHVNKVESVQDSAEDAPNTTAFVEPETTAPSRIFKMDPNNPSLSLPLPAYIKRLSTSLLPEDVRYLWAKGAFSLPNAQLRVKLIQAYIQFVYPSLPLINLAEFARIMSHGGEDGQNISLILFQAIMFAGAAFVDPLHLQMAGYNTRREARTAFYQKVRLLYEFDCESDRLPIIQSLLLITYQHESAIEGKDDRHWLSLAISLAFTIKLNRNPDMSTNTLNDRRLRKRIWWSCVLRDRLLALGMKKVPIIDDESFDVPMLTLDDFELEPTSSQTVHSDWSMVNNVPLLKELAVICIAKTKICLCISNVLRTQYIELVRDQGMQEALDGSNRSRVTLSPKESTDMNSVQLCDLELSQWFDKLDPLCQYNTPTIEDLQKNGPSLLVERAVLHAVYYSTIYVLHRPQLLSSKPTNSSSHHEFQAASRERIRIATKETGKLILDLNELNLTRYLPGTAVTVLYPLITSHLLDIMSSDGESREESLRGLNQCIHVLKELRDKYRPADEASEFLETAVIKARININPNSSLARGDFNPKHRESESESELEADGDGNIVAGDPVTHNQPAYHFNTGLSSSSLNESAFENTKDLDFDLESLESTAASYMDNLSFLFDSNDWNSNLDINGFHNLYEQAQ